MAENTIGEKLVRAAGWLDPFAKAVGAVVSGFYKIPGTTPIKNLLHGTWILRHPLHPAVTDATVGGYTMLALLDIVYLARHEPSLAFPTDLVLVATTVTAIVSAVSGLTDWNETDGNDRRLGILHGLLMLAATIGFVASGITRVQGGIPARDGAIYLALLSYVVLIAAAYIGGELPFGHGVGVNRQAWTQRKGDWETLDVTAASLGDRAPVVARTKAGVPVFVAKLDNAIYAIGNRCTHLACPLNEGEWVGSDRCEIRCRCHGSEFCVRDGGVRRGPATANELTWETRVSAAGQVEVRPSR
jgi:nitrite reductase/ring-hydroxylating ferredoxin subunit